METDSFKERIATEYALEFGSSPKVVSIVSRCKVAKAANPRCSVSRKPVCWWSHSYQVPILLKNEAWSRTTLVPALEKNFGTGH
jgi:hypothetical protein